MSKKQKIILPSLLLAFTLNLVFLAFLALAPKTVLAEDIKMTFQVPIGDLKEVTIGPNSIGNYIQSIYKYLVGSVGIIATVVMMYAGILWITAAGNTGQITEAKAWLTAAMTGMVIALASYVILYWVNPDLLDFKEIAPTEISKTAASNISNLLDCTDGSLISLSPKNDSSAPTKCSSNCGSNSINNTKSKYSSDGLNYCCICNSSSSGCCVYKDPLNVTQKKSVPTDISYDDCKIIVGYRFYNSSCENVLSL